MVCLYCFASSILHTWKAGATLHRDMRLSSSVQLPTRLQKTEKLCNTFALEMVLWYQVGEILYVKPSIGQMCLFRAQAKCSYIGLKCKLSSIPEGLTRTAVTTTTITKLFDKH